MYLTYGCTSHLYSSFKAVFCVGKRPPVQPWYIRTYSTMGVYPLSEAHFAHPAPGTYSTMP